MFLTTLRRFIFLLSFKEQPNNTPTNYSTYHIFLPPYYSFNLKTRIKGKSRKIVPRHLHICAKFIRNKYMKTRVWGCPSNSSSTLIPNISYNRNLVIEQFALTPLMLMQMILGLFPLLILSMFMFATFCHVDNIDSTNSFIFLSIEIWECALNWSVRVVRILR